MSEKKKKKSDELRLNANAAKDAYKYAADKSKSKSVRKAYEEVGDSLMKKAGKSFKNRLKTQSMTRTTKKKK